MNQHISLLNLFLAIIVTVLWGLNFVFAKIGLLHFSPFFMLLLRFIIVTLILLPFYPKPPIKLYNIAIISLLFSVLHLGFMFWSLYLGLDSSIGVITQQLSIPFVLLLSIVFFKEKIGIKSAIGVSLAIFGTIILIKAPNSIQYPLAFMLIIGSAFSWALYSCALKKIQSVNPLALITWISLLSIPMIIPLTIIFENNQIYSLKTATIFPILSLLYTVP